VAGAQSENMLISKGAGPSLVNKILPRDSEEQDFRNKTAGARSENSKLAGAMLNK
jgi:hypothetical protein